MAEEAKGAAAPGAVERSRLLTLPVSGQTVEVRRWSYQRLMQISQFMKDIIGGLPEDVSVQSGEALGLFYQHGAKKFLEVARLSVAPEHRNIVTEEMDSSDAFAVMEVAFELNDAGANLKKATGLAGLFLLTKAAAKAQQESEATTKAAT